MTFITKCKKSSWKRHFNRSQFVVSMYLCTKTNNEKIKEYLKYGLAPYPLGSFDEDVSKTFLYEQKTFIPT